jgi:hypothetical protein
MRETKTIIELISERGKFWNEGNSREPCAVKVASTVRGEEVRKGLSSDTTWKIQAGLRKQRYLAGPLPYLIRTASSHAGADGMETIIPKPLLQPGRVIISTLALTRRNVSSRRVWPFLSQNGLPPWGTSERKDNACVFQS